MAALGEDSSPVLMAVPLVPPPNQRRAQPRFVLIAVAALLVTAASSGFAQRTQFDLAVSSDITATNNSLVSATAREADVVVAVRPRFSFLGEGPKLRLSATGAANAIAYTRKTQESGILPELDAQATAVAIERAMTIEVGARVFQVFE